MADFTNQEKETLEKLRKAFENKGLTSTARQPWQELFSHETSAATSSVLAAEIIAGFSGSWAASYNYGSGAGSTVSLDNTVADTPVPVRARRTKLGERGVPEINFVPYNWRTNRFGSKGPSLVGHPISYSVVGPTLKSPFCDWTWEVQQGAGPNGGDLLLMDVRPDGAAATATTIVGGYNIANFSIGAASEPNGGLYVLITDDGSNPGSLSVGAVAMGALDPYVDTARYELFRVSDVRAGQIELHPSKPLSTYFDLPAASTRAVRSITVISPFVTRLAAVPGSGPGVGHERTFVVIQPEFAASSDLYPPYNGTAPADGTWLRGGFESTGAVGEAQAYGGASPLPIPRPLRESRGIIEKVAVASAALGGQFIVQNVEDPTASDIGRIMRIYHVDLEEGATPTIGSTNQALGWFAIRNVVGSTYTLRRVAEVDPTDGATFFGPGPVFISGEDPVQHVYFTVHASTRTLWTSSTFAIDATESVRLKNLIDPIHVKRAEKKLSDTAGYPIPGGATPDRADRAIFETRTNLAAAPSVPANPGSLLDLGFRMVLFPARNVGGSPVPDYNRPITTREVVIDPAVAEAQYIDIDYSAGLVRLSHAPPTGSAGQIVPNGIIGGADNPRGEVVLFAACVPYSMEPTQLGGGTRVTGGVDGNEDVFSERITATIDAAATVFTGVAPFFSAAGIVLESVWEGPPTGVIDILGGNAGDNGLGAPSLGTWGYSAVDNSGPTSVLTLVSNIAGATDPDPPAGETRTVVLRREVFFGNESLSNSPDVDDVRFDSVYGASSRASILRFPGANLRRLIDGSTEVQMDLSPAQFAFASYQWGYFSAAALPAANALSNKFYSENGFIEPLVYQDNANPDSGATGGGYGLSNSQGPRLRLASLVNDDDYKGVMCEFTNNSAGVVALNSFTRFVTKFEINASGEDYVFFAGLIGATGATSPNSDVAVSEVAPPADIVQVGLRVFGTLSPNFGFFGLGSGGAASIPTGISSDGTGVYHFVMETLTGPEVRYGLFDDAFNLLAQGVIANSANLPLGTTGLYPIVAIRKVSAGVPRVNLDTWFTHVITRFDTVGPPLLSP